jgi:Transposase DDE domain
VWTRKGRRTISHDLRELSDKESQRWIATALAAKPLLAKAAMVTVLGDRESDIFALYANAAEQHFHVVARSMHDRKLADGIGLYAASEAMAVVDRHAIVLPARAQRAERVAVLELRFGAVNLARPQTRFLRHLPESLPLTLVDVREVDPEAGKEPLHWRLLATHTVASAEEAWRIVEWYKRRWLIEQFHRVLKTQGFKLEDSQIATADRLLKLVAIAPRPQSSPSSFCRRATAVVISPSGLPSMPTRSQRSPPSIKISRPKVNGSGTRIRPTASHGPPGSSAASAAGTAILLLNRQAPLP